MSDKYDAEEMEPLCEYQIREHFKQYMLENDKEGVLAYGDKYRIWRASAEYYLRLHGVDIVEFYFAWNNEDLDLNKGEEGE